MVLDRIATGCNTSRFAHAFHLWREGFSLIPLKRKKPVRKWKPYQTQQCSLEELTEWFHRKDYEIGIVTGALSGITVVDCDTIEAGADLDSPLTQSTKRGVHLVYRWKGERNTVRLCGREDVDRRGEGGYVVAYPGSLKWTRRAVDCWVPDVPERLNDGTGTIG